MIRNGGGDNSIIKKEKEKKKNDEIWSYAQALGWNHSNRCVQFKRKSRISHMSL